MKHGPGPAKLKPQRVAERSRERVRSREKEEQNRQRSKRGGQPNELGIVQGQNGEQGNTVEPRNAQPLGRSAQ